MAARRCFRWLTPAILASLVLVAGFWFAGRGRLFRAGAAVPVGSATSLGFVQTTYSSAGLPSNPTWRDRFLVSFQNFMTRHGRKNPANWSFPATSAQRCSVHGLLNQCMEMSGTRYFIDPEAACGSVEFGHSNALNGVQWLASFEGALQTNQPECLNLITHHLYRTNLILIREKPGLVKVISPRRLAEFQKAGLTGPLPPPTR